MLTVIVCLWDGGEHVPERSRIFTPEWADKLYRGIARNYNKPFRFVCLTHYPQSSFKEPVEAISFLHDTRKWTCINEIFRPDLGIEKGIFMGLDTIITGDLTEIFDNDFKNFCMIEIVKERHNVLKKVICNAVVIFNAESGAKLWGRWQIDEHRIHRMSGMIIKECVSEMQWQVWAVKKLNIKMLLLNKLYPGQIASWRLTLNNDIANLKDSRIVYFHGSYKPDNCPGAWEYWI